MLDSVCFRLFWKEMKENEFGLFFNWRIEAKANRFYLLNGVPRKDCQWIAKG